jgi:hypothetical protein
VSFPEESATAATHRDCHVRARDGRPGPDGLLPSPLRVGVDRPRALGAGPSLGVLRRPVGCGTTRRCASRQAGSGWISRNMTGARSQHDSGSPAVPPDLWDQLNPWCEGHLGSTVAQVLFLVRRLGTVIGVHASGRTPGRRQTRQCRGADAAPPSESRGTCAAKDFPGHARSLSQGSSSAVYASTARPRSWRPAPGTGARCAQRARRPPALAPPSPDRRQDWWFGEHVPRSGTAAK